MDGEKQSRNAWSFWEDTVTGSVKARTLGEGKRFDAIFKFHKVMTGDGSEENEWKEEVLAEMETVLIDAPPLGDEALAYVDKHGDVARIYLNSMLEFETLNHVVFTVAHEFAHIWLKHHRGEGSIAQQTAPGTEHKDKPHEKEADKLAEKWGFKRPKGKGWIEKTILAYAGRLKSKREQKRFAAAMGRNASASSRLSISTD
jgi:hypothetical protein